MNKINGTILKKSISKNNFGGKGNYLIFLRNNNFCVPDTILFDIDEIFKYLKGKINSLENRLRDIALNMTNKNFPEPIELLSLRDDLIGISPPENWEIEYKFIKEKLGNNLIIRSSMNIEDTQNESMAGCFDSICINNPNAEILWESIKNVLCSALSKSSIIRILESTLDFSSIRFGFLIQKYIQPKVSGVCFSRNPLNIWKGEALCEYSSLANSVVQGTGITQTVQKNEIPNAIIAPFWINLWDNALSLEKKLKAVIDYEWVWDGKKLWIVQVRKVVTEEARFFQRVMNGEKWSRELTQERFPEPLTPLSWSSISDLFISNVRILNDKFGIIVKKIDDIGISFCGYVYANTEIFKFPKGLKIRWSHYLTPRKKIFWKILPLFFKAFFKIILFKLKKIDRLFFKLEIINLLFEEQYLREYSNWHYEKNKFINEIKIFKERLLLYKEMNNIDILREMEVLKQIGENFLESDFSIYIMKDTIHKAIKEIFNLLKFKDFEFSYILEDFSTNKTIDFSLECLDLVSTLKKDKNGFLFLSKLENVISYEQFDKIFIILNSDSKNKWEKFLENNGHLRTSWDFIKSNLREAPWEWVSIFKSYYNKDINENKKKYTSDLIKQSLKDKLLKLNRVFLYRKIIDISLVLKNLMYIDEEQHFYSGLIVEQSKYLLQAAENYLIKKGLLFERNSVFFLEIKELKFQLNNPSAVMHFLTMKRKKLWQQYKSISNNIEVEDHFKTFDINDNLLLGNAMSPGEAEGEIYFVEHISDTFNIPEGAIIITTSPNPTLTVLYPIISGMITVSGGILSHGFIAAREYGLPAVSGICQAFSMLKQGMRVKLNGTLGTVEIVATK